MKTTLLFILIVIAAGCNNSSESETKTDSLVNEPVYHVPSGKGDTSSYDRMQDKIVDSMER